MDTLLPYYERELTFLRRLSQDFARRHPKVASRLLLSGEACDDPHIERLIESFAFLAGRIHKKLDDEFPEFTDSLLQVIAPQFLRPFPSVSIAQFDSSIAEAQMSADALVPRGTVTHTRLVRGVACRFTTAYDVHLWPVRVTGADHESLLDSSSLPARIARLAVSAIRIDLSLQNDSPGFNALGIGKLRFFLNGDPSVVALLREAIFSGAVGIWVSTAYSSHQIELPLSAIRPVGFADNEFLIDPDVRTHSAYQLLLEYFVFPEKFNFFDLDLTALAGRVPAQARSMEVRIGLRDFSSHGMSVNLLDRIGPGNFVLGCTPVVNLFAKNPEPIRVTNTVTSYPVIIDSRRPQAYEVHAIQRVFRVQTGEDGDDLTEYRPFYSLRHGEAHDGPARYWHASYIDEIEDKNFTLELSIVDTSLQAHVADISTLSLDAMCTNRNLPSYLPFGLPDGDLFLDGGSVARTIRFLRKPTQSFRFPLGRGAQWRMISHLTLNHLSLSGMGVEAIREMLTLYDITRSSANGRQISGIHAIEHRPATTRLSGNPFPAMVRGMEVSVTLDESHYAGIGVYTFAQILDHFFGLYVHTNSFTQLVVLSRQTGQELLRCPARSGESILA